MNFQNFQNLLNFQNFLNFKNLTNSKYRCLNNYKMTRVCPLSYKTTCLLLR